MYIIEYRDAMYRGEVKHITVKTDKEVVDFVVNGSFSSDGRNGGIYDRTIVLHIMRSDENDNGKLVPCYIRCNKSGLHVREIVPEEIVPELEMPEVIHTY